MEGMPQTGSDKNEKSLLGALESEISIDLTTPLEVIEGQVPPVTEEDRDELRRLNNSGDTLH